MISLHGVHLMNHGPGRINIEGSTIASMHLPDHDGQDDRSTRFHFDDAIAFPGLINSHDHLDFNLFPRLGNRIYSNCPQWGADIHAVNRKTIDAILNIPQPLRTQWGLYKNLLNGVTTVVQHGEHLRLSDPVIDVFQQCNVLHSVQQEPHWKLKLNNPFARGWPFVIHAGEGTDGQSLNDIDTLIRWNVFRRELIGVHGVAMNEEQASAFAALVWCPDSNYFLLNRTADIPRLQRKTTVVFGTDSTLSASWNLWEQLRLARKLGMMTDEALFQSVTQTPATVWRLPRKGILREGGQADIVVAKRAGGGEDDLAAWFAVNPEDIMLVIQNGSVRLCDEARYRQLRENRSSVEAFSQIVLQDSTKYVRGNLPGLIAEIKEYAPGAVFPIGSSNA